MGSPTIHELPEQDRPREKLAKHGAANLSDSELIAILLRTGMQGINAVDLARQLIQRFGTLGDLARASVTEIAKVKGVGPTKAVQLAAAFGLAARLARETIARLPMDKPTLVYEMLGAEMRQLEKESLRVVLLDTKLKLMRVEEVSLGSLNECLAHPRDILRPAISHNAYGFILVHNHPSGDPTPSEADRRLTVRITEAARLLQVTMLDHIIIGVPAPGRLPYFSFREAGIV
jgi:DNA repair protein RadC